MPQPLENLEKSLASLSVPDKLELVERLVHEVRFSAATGQQTVVSPANPITEADFKQQLLKSGLMASLPTPPDDTPRPAFQPVMIEGEPLSETILRERR